MQVCANFKYQFKYFSSRTSFVVAHHNDPQSNRIYYISSTIAKHYNNVCFMQYICLKYQLSPHLKLIKAAIWSATCIHKLHGNR